MELPRTSQDRVPSSPERLSSQLSAETRVRVVLSLLRSSAHASVPEVYINVYKFVCKRAPRVLLMNIFIFPPKKATKIYVPITQDWYGVWKRSLDQHLK